MENNNNKIVKIILLLFFLVLIILPVGFYFWNQEQLKKIDEKPLLEEDEDFNNFFKDKEKKTDIEFSENAKTEKANCFAGDVLVKDGEKIKLYSKQIVHPFENCEDYAKERYCNNGVFLGDELYKYPKCKKNLDCELPDGSIVKNGTKAHLYSRKSVPYNKRGETCEKYAIDRLCKETILSGPKEYVFRDCRINYNNSCTLSNNEIRANNQIFKMYKKNQVAWNKKCDSKDNMKLFTCSEGIIVGGDISQYPFTTCVPKAPQDCYLLLNLPEGGNKRVPFKHNQNNIKLFGRGFRTDRHDCRWYSMEFDCVNGEMKLSYPDEGDYKLEDYTYFDCYNN